jgi:RimJ/RimL family protein N-acetyltransferase
MLPNVSQHSMANFIAYFYNKTMLICVAKPGKIAGFVWVYDVEGNNKFKRASVGVCFFKEYWGNPVIYELGRLALGWMFKELNLSMVLGTIASWNRASVRFGKALGFEYCGTVPMFFLKEDSATAMDMVSLSKEKFYHG